MSTPLTTGFRRHLKITFILYQCCPDSAVKAECLYRKGFNGLFHIHLYRAEAKVGVVGGRTTHDLYKKLSSAQREVYVHADC